MEIKPGQLKLEQPETIHDEPDKRETVSQENAELSSSEIQENVPLAVDIARFRSEVERSIFKAPRKEWRKIYGDTLAKYPQVLDYKPIFNSVISSTELANDNINKLVAEQRLGPRWVVDRDMFAYLFGFKPGLDMKAQRGQISLKFLVNEDDFRKALETVGTGNLETNLITRAFATTQKGIHILLFRQDEKRVNKPSKYHILHELEHAKNRVLNNAEAAVFESDLEKVEMPDEILSRLADRHLKDNFMEVNAKDELLAQFTILEVVRGSLDERRTEKLKNFGKFLKKLLTDPQQGYYAGYIKENDNPSDKENTGYTKNVEGGIDAFLELYLHYRNLPEKDKKLNDARLVINILSQFPLCSWAAVARLIISRSKS